MALQRISSATTTGNSITIPTHAPGDLIIIYAVKDVSSGDLIAVPGGWEDIGGPAAFDFREQWGYRHATSSSMTSGTWTGATSMVAIVYRGGYYISIASDINNGSTINYPARNLMTFPNQSWILRGGGHKTASNLTSNLTSGFTFVNGSATTLVTFDTNGASSNKAAYGQSVNASHWWSASTLELGSPPLISTLVDDFSDGTFTSTKFVLNGGGAAATVGSGVLTIPSDGYVYAKSVHDIYDGTIVFDITQMPQYTNADASTIYMSSDYEISNNGGFAPTITRYNGNLHARVWVSGSTYNDYTTPYNASAMRYIRARHSSSLNKFYFDYSADGIFWTNLSETNMTTLQSAGMHASPLQFVNYNVSGTPTNLIINSVNVIPSGGGGGILLFF